MIAPLGNGFSIPPGKSRALLAAGGMGIAPLLHLAAFLTANFPKIQVIAFAGAKTLPDLPFNLIDAKKAQKNHSNEKTIAEFAKFDINTHIATDDGSIGFNGFVTDCLIKWLNETKPPHDDIIIYACGPEPMLARTAQIAAEQNIDCQISMERRMACGIGICQSCAVETKTADATETVYKLCCKDGPVFDSKDIVFNLQDSSD